MSRTARRLRRQQKATHGFNGYAGAPLVVLHFVARDVLQDFDFTAIKKTKIEPLFEVWITLPEAQRVPMEVDLRAIGNMSNEQGVKAIIDEAEFHMDEDGEHHAFVALLMALPGHHERAMMTFLDYPNLWKGATRLYHADTLSHWRKRKNLPKVLPVSSVLAEVGHESVGDSSAYLRASRGA